MTFTPNAEQIKSALRWFVQTFGGMIAGWFAAKGYFTVDQVVTVLNSPALLATAATIITGIWGLFVHTQANAVATVDAIPAVAGVVVKNTDDGHALADAAPSSTVAVEGTAAAASVAAK